MSVKTELFSLNDNIVCLQCTDIINNFPFIVITTYLSPDGSTYANTDECTLFSYGILSFAKT